MFKKIRPFIGILLFLVLSLLGTFAVFFSLAATLVLPILWVVFTGLHQMKPTNKRITYLWNGTRTSLWVYFASFFLFWIWTPAWMKKLSIYLQRYSFFEIFDPTFINMYGRLFIAFLLAISCFCVCLVLYRFEKKKNPTA